MRKLILFLSATLISLASFAQASTKTVCLPDSIMGKVIDELIVKDHLQFTVHELDSTVIFYKSTVDSLRAEVVVLKLDKNNYETAITSLKEDVQSKNSRITDLKRENFKTKIVSFLKGFVIGVATVVTYLVIHSVTK